MTGKTRRCVSGNRATHIVRGEKLWDKLRREIPGFTCAKLFWWYNMHSTADFSITPRPLYPADGRKVFDVHTQPMGMREELKKDLGPFPFQAFWGPAAGIASSEWIAASAKWVEEKHSPDAEPRLSAASRLSAAEGRAAGG